MATTSKQETKFQGKPEIKFQGAIEPPPKGSFVYFIDGRKIAYTATMRVEDLSKRKGGGFDPVYRHKDSTFWLTPEEDNKDAFGVVIRETGIKEAFIGLAQPKKVEKKNATIVAPPAAVASDPAPQGEAASPANPS